MRIPWRVALDYLWYPEETTSTPLFDERGVRIGFFGAREYSNRWAAAWREAIKRELDFPGAPPHMAGSYPPLDASVTRLRPDQVCYDNAPPQASSIRDTGHPLLLSAPCVLETLR